MWQWDNMDPFGANVANENPAGQGTFRYSQRFPGQYYDAETATNYNYFRDYDSAIGRYIESDPIGLLGGANTFAYTGGGPVDKIDPNGLAWYCTAPLHVAPSLDFGGRGPAHHAFLCDKEDHCGGQDWSRQPWYGNPILGPGTPSVGDTFNPGRCDRILPDNECMNSCIAKLIDDPDRPAYSVIPNVGAGIYFAVAPNCQEWAKKGIANCRAQCADKKDGTKKGAGLWPR
jgi:RHS repeat-associated protein